MDDKTLELIDDYLDGRLEGPALAAFEARLAEPELAAALDERGSLNALLESSAPVLSEADSRRLWAGIQARIAAAPAPAKAEPWYAFLTRPWAPAYSWGLGAAAAAVAIVLLIQPKIHGPQAELAKAEAGATASAAEAAGAIADEAPAPTAPQLAKAGTKAEAGKKQRPEAEAKAKDTLARAKEEAPAAAPTVAEAAPAAAAALEKRSIAPTEVERALAESDAQVDRMIESFLAQGGRPALQPLRSDDLRAPTERVSLAAFNTGAGRSAEPGTSRAIQGLRDQNGFWDWRPAAVAMNQRDWSQAQVELEAAMAQAAEASERAFAASALTLLSAQNGPLEGQTGALPDTGELRVLGAGRWQLAVDERLARFSQGVSARLPGFRVVGDSLELDLTFDRGSFGPGTRFTRVADPQPARVINASDELVGAGEFSAPRGAVYNVQGRELRLR